MTETLAPFPAYYARMTGRDAYKCYTAKGDVPQLFAANALKGE